MNYKRHLNKVVLLVLFCFLQIVVFSQTRTITGTVTSDKGEPLPGVSIVIKGTTTGTTTDINGKYGITASDGDVLSFSFIGYLSKEIKVSGNTTVDVALVEDLMQLDEVVVVGYGVSKKSDLTGSVSSLKEDDFNQTSGGTPEDLIQGRLAGVQITSNNGEPGAGSQIRIRGASTIRSSQQPLYVIDGIPIDASASSPDGATADGLGGAPATNPLSFLNANDIESIDILKDASAAAIYGSRGANGVVIITTKKGKGGASEVNYSTTMSISKLPKKLPVLSADEWVTYRRDSLNLAPADINDEGYKTDWQDQIFRTALSQSHSLSFTGGTEKTSYRASFNYLDENGIIKKSDMKRYYGRINIAQSAIKDRLHIEANITASQTLQNRPPIGTTGFQGDLILNALKANPTWPLYDSAGAPYQTTANERNPVAMLDYTNDVTKTSRIIAGGTATLDLIKGLNYKISLGADYTNATRKANQSQKLLYLSDVGGRAQINTKEYFNYVVENTLNYSKKFGINTINVLAGFSYQSIDRSGYGMQAGGFTTDVIEYTNVMSQGTPETRTVTSYANTLEELQSFFGRINYNLNEKYLFTATLRRDGSSKFGKNNKYGNFPSLAFAWRLSQEDFINNLNVFNNLKLRVGWGQTGNSEIEADNSTFLLKPDPGSTAIIDNVPIKGYAINKTPQPNLKWETTTSTNVGLDWGVFGGRLSGTVDLFQKKTTDLLLEKDTKALAPTSTYIDNLKDGYILNKGIEFEINAVAITGDDFSWNIGFNFTAIKNKAVKIRKDDKTIIPTGSVQGQGLTGSYAQAYANNRPMASFYLYQVDSLSPKGRIYYTPRADGKDSLVFMGSPLPKYNWGLNNSFKYKNFDFSFFIESVQGNYVFNNTALLLDKSNLKQSTNTLKYFAEDNTYYSNTPVQSDRYLEDGSFIRLSNATLGYTFNVSNISWIKRLRLYASGSNLFLITKYKGFDPDVSSSADMNGVRSIGIDVTNYPKARTFLFGLNVTF